MNTKLFIGLTFFPDNSFAKNIDSFRSRFDSKYQAIPYLHLAAVPPFEIEMSELKKLKEELEDELDSFYFENTKDHVLNFTGLDVHEYKKNKLLYLNPVMEEELVLMRESLSSICQSYISDRQKKIKDNKKSFLTIGRFQESIGLHSSIELAKKEFHEFTSLPYESVCLFRKNNGVWHREAVLATFEKPSNDFLQTANLSV